MKDQTSPAKLVIFVKAPHVGHVKTRLAANIGESAACAAYKKMVEHLMGNLRALDTVEIRFSPDNAVEELREWLGERFEFQAQGNGDLGERLQRAFRESFAHGFSRVVIIGSDCPQLTCKDIVSAWNELACKDVVLGPAADGGYWLIGLRSNQAALFQNIPWSSEVVLETTLNRIRDAKLSYHFLRTLSDIDTENDWKSYLKKMGDRERLSKLL